MKLTSLLLGASLATNLVLAGVYFSRISAVGIGRPAGTSLALTAATDTSVKAKRVSTDSIWQHLGSTPPATLIEQLRAAGCPPGVLRAIVEQHFELRREALTFDGNDVPYWKKAPEVPADPKTSEALAALEREMRAAQQLLEEMPPTATDEWQVLRSRRYGNLAPEKIARIEALQQSFAERVMALQRTGEVTGATFMAKLQEMDRQQHDQLAQVLTPAELREHDLRNGSTQSLLKGNLTGLKVSEEEFRALFQLYQERDTLFPARTGGVAADDARARAVAQAQMDRQIETLLGAERFALYELSSRPGAQALNQLVTRLELPLTKAAEVHAVQQDIQSRANAVRADAQLSAAARAEQLAALSQEATTKITVAIGARGMEGYRQNGGQWLQQLQARLPGRPNGK